MDSRLMVMEKIDVVMLTKNSEEILEKCLESIYASVPVNKLIVVDGYSIDRTSKILEKYKNKHGKVQIILDKGTRAQCRELGIRYVSTNWFMFVDSDVVLCKGWFETAKKQMNDDVGCIWGLDLDITGYIHGIITRFFIAVAYLSFKLRGGTHDTLIRTETVRSMKIPPQLHTYEDAYIIKWIRKKGYKTIIGKGIFCYHIKPSVDWNLRETLRSVLSEIKCSLVFSRTYKFCFYFPVYVTYWFVHWLLLNGRKIQHDHANIVALQRE